MISPEQAKFALIRILYLALRDLREETKALRAGERQTKAETYADFVLGLFDDAPPS